MSDVAPDRRHILRGIICGCCSLATGVGRAGSFEASGCSLTAEAASALDRSKLSASLDGRDGVRAGMTFSTGDGDLDRALDAAILRISQLFGVTPGFAFFDDSSSPNAFAADYSYFPDRRYSVVFGRRLFREFLAADPSGISIVLVLAHEFAHLKQFALPATRNELMAGQTTVKRLELHADAMAGWYLSQRKMEHPEASFYRSGEALWKIGDYGYANPGHHGTPEERTAAADYGFRLGWIDGKSFDETFRLARTWALTR